MFKRHMAIVKARQRTQVQTKTMTKFYNAKIQVFIYSKLRSSFKGKINLGPQEIQSAILTVEF